ncbi:interleukin-10 receptor subunit beta precursor [Silurus asotus]|uniref:Interleukin-10 receptor subunit beta n=1 Tax=Silurus asotus TaxID=30991 RepID=A0AAD5B4V7_SILAS|nr:interleukin-10 receptor subunit beta precursor [Silurus asotus]
MRKAVFSVQCSFPSPQNVSIVSFNLEHKLTWIPGPGTEAFTKFRVQSLNQRKKLWASVKSCSDLELGETCDLTESFTEGLGFYQARVQAFSQDKESNWTTSKFFTPLLDTTLGPPLVSVTGCGNCLILRLSPPASMEQNHNPLPYIYQHYSINVSRTRDKAQFAMKASNGETLINYLEPGAEYCITAIMVTSFNNPVVPSDPQCSLTSPQPLNTGGEEPKRCSVIDRNPNEHLFILSEENPVENPNATEEHFCISVYLSSWDSFKIVCVNISAPSCDLTNDVSAYGNYILRVRTELDGKSSAWTETNCEPLETITVIGPPSVKLQSRKGKMEVDITDPVLKKGTLKDYFTNIIYHIHYWAEGKMEQEKMVDQSRVMLTKVLPETLYCMRVEINLDYKKQSLPSNITCEMNTALDEVEMWLILVVLLVSFLVTLISVLLITMAVWGGYRGIRYLRPKGKLPEHFKQYLLERPTSSILAMQNNTPLKEPYHEFSIITFQEVPPKSMQKESSKPSQS